MVATAERYGVGFCVRIRHANQFFRLNYFGTRAECRWMAKMFNKALKAHDEEVKRGR